jgi:transposase
LWALVEPLLPAENPKPNGGRPRVPNRSALEGIVYVSRSGIPWRMLPREIGCSGVTRWRRLRDWHKAGVWRSLQRASLDRLGVMGRVDRSRASLDSASVPAKRRTGPNPVDRGRPGSKRPLIVDGNGVPLAVIFTSAQVHDSTIY